MTEQENLKSVLASMSAEQAARRLLGCELVRQTPAGTVRVRIVETEAYDESDEASHSFRGKTKRNEVMFGPAGRLYVYFTYGMHHCGNIVVGEDGYSAAVLVRAVEPLEGEDIMLHNRHGRGGKYLADGPGKVCQALLLDTSLNGHELCEAPLELQIKPPVDGAKITASTRIGISRAREKLWRFILG